MGNKVIERAAKAAHEVNRAYCVAIGDFSQVSWEDAPENIRRSAIDGVKAYLQNPRMSPKEIHENWVAFKLADGWVYGETKDPESKTHPCLVSYEDLPGEQKTKDALFVTIVRGVLPESVVDEYDSE